MGLLTGVGFLIRGAKAKNRLWIILGIGFLAVGIGLLATSGVNQGTKEAPVRTVAGTIWGWVWFTTFIAGVVTSFIANKKWLIWKAHTSDVKWYAAAGASQAPNASPAWGYDPNAAAAAFTQQAPSAAALQPPTGSLDLNSASVQELVTALGVDSETAGRIVEARQSAGSFTSFEQLMTRAQVPPHFLIPHRDKISFGTPAPQAQPQAQESGSRKARRLFD